MSSQPSYLKLMFQGEIFTHNGCNDCCSSRGKQQLFEKAVPIIERFYQRPLMPGTLKTHKDKGADSNCIAFGGYTQIKTSDKHLGESYRSSMQTLKVEQTLLQAGFLHTHLKMRHLLHTHTYHVNTLLRSLFAKDTGKTSIKTSTNLNFIREAQLTPFFLQPVGDDVDSFLHFWFSVAVI